MSESESQFVWPTLKGSLWPGSSSREKWTTQKLKLKISMTITIAKKTTDNFKQSYVLYSTMLIYKALKSFCPWLKLLFNIWNSLIEYFDLKREEIFTFPILN